GGARSHSSPLWGQLSRLGTSDDNDGAAPRGPEGHVASLVFLVVVCARGAPGLQPCAPQKKEHDGCDEPPGHQCVTLEERLYGVQVAAEDEPHGEDERVPCQRAERAP